MVEFFGLVLSVLVIGDSMILLMLWCLVKEWILVVMVFLVLMN